MSRRLPVSIRGRLRFVARSAGASLDDALGMFGRTGVLKRRHYLALLCVSVLLLFGTQAFAADDDKVIFPGGSPKSETATAPKGGNLNRVTLGVGLILAGVGGWLVWRNRRRVASGRAVQALAVEETRSLGNRQFLVVASYEGKKFLLGVCPGQINLLSPLTSATDEDPSHE